jgi:hypothetical protein
MRFRTPLRSKAAACLCFVLPPKRADGVWRLREELNSDQPFGSAIALPPDASVKADLAAPCWN